MEIELMTALHQGFRSLKRRLVLCSTRGLIVLVRRLSEELSEELSGENYPGWECPFPDNYTPVQSRKDMLAIHVMIER